MELLELERQRHDRVRDLAESRTERRRQGRHQWINSGVLLIGAVLAGGSLLATAATLRTGQDELRTAKEGQVTDRYTKAVEQLGSGKREVRTAAVYALERIAVDSPRDRLTVRDVLAAFVREHDPAPRVRAAALPEEPDTDVAAALTVLSRRPTDPPTTSSLDLHEIRIPRNFFPNGAKLGGANLSGADLRGANLSIADLRGTNLSGADLREADLNRANLQETNLSRVKLNGAGLRGVDLSRKDLSNVNLHRADLTGVDLSAANLTGADLTGADLSGANLFGARLEGVSLRGVRLRGATLRGAPLYGAPLRDTDLNGADLRDADLGRADLRDASLLKTDLRYAHLSGAKLRGADLRGANLKGVDFEFSEEEIREVAVVDDYTTFG
ncbi:pentapeptide repeat-containing protein [Actinomadura rubrisoli]|uniref:pentapeptide repeat-containing protein n=1 Tax=Actinomadura rubrisoli TaxID=2530368 RepID=UPI00104C97D5|nr:pentapeptide repeat-containing protein [Actinomadura rubrisoli]